MAPHGRSRADRQSWSGELEPIGRDVGRELGRFGPQAGMADLLEAWPRAAGEAIARNAWPARISRDGTVHVHTSDSVWAFELGQRAGDLAARLGEAGVVVEKLRFAAGPLPEATPEAVERTVISARPEDLERARAIAAPIEDESLRERVQKAVSLGLARAAHDRRI